ncbi:GW dipeptide domain-containing protein [Staphylococcus americanisciuri]|uniref:Bifunctional autolysin n=1 Tax=Staphylococcus americanisciuri TaxID=2973940 RepID=A0ABT2F2I5_9STAP|nr:GW dipeptide domain-containing protein [Staphylococcus americanisciuri]MCS4486670.1 GW dipeptide domain-containing protein [Staphylococcus americanisciuri]
MVKKFGYKTSSMLALTIAGTAFTAHQVDAAENANAQKEPVNVLNDQVTKQQGEVAKQQTTENDTQIAGTQTYQDPSQIQIDNSNVTTANNIEQVTSEETTPPVTSSTTSEENAETLAQATEAPLSAEEAPIDEADIDLHAEAETNTAVQSEMNATMTSPETTVASTQPVDAAATNTPEETADIVTADVPATTNYVAEQGATNTTTETANTNPDGPTPPRIGGKGGPATTATAFRSAFTPRQATAVTYKPAVNSSINTYIRNKNFTVPRYEEDYSSHIPRYAYRNGVGKPEGIVIHDTANDSSTIDGEIAYMKRNYNSAFVHGFIDGNRIVETQPTDYLAWGAGYQANQRFIHMELVHVHDYDSFARQMNNMADYVATNLVYYGLQPDSAEYDGVGTVWTHLAVSRHLGGTDHVDPHGYLNAHGYSYAELYDLIQEKYQTKMGITAPAVTPQPTTKPTTTKPTTTKPTTSVSQNNLTVANNLGYGRINTKNNGLYTTVYDQNGKVTNQVNRTLKVTKTANLNGNQFYLMTDAKSNALLGWVKKGDVQYQAAQAEQALSKQYTVKPGTTVYTVPWGTTAQVAGTTSKTASQSFTSQKQQKIGSTQWLYGTVNQLTGWINSNSIVATPNATKPTPSKPATTPASGLTVTNDQGMGRINTSNNGLFVSVYDKYGKKTTATDQTMRVSKKASLNGQDYYLVTDYLSGTHLGWVKKQDVDYRTSEYAQVINQHYTINAGTQLFATPWGSSKQVVGTVSGKGSQAFQAIRQQKVANNVYVYGIVNNLQGWVNKNVLALPKATTNVTSNVSKIGRLKTTNDGLKATIYDKTSKNAAAYADKTYKITKTATANNQNYVLLQNTNGNTPLGWVKTDDVFSQSLSATKPVKASYTVNKNTAGLYSVPWGTTKQRIDTLKQLADRTFNATKSVVIGKDTFLYGNVNRKTGWIHQNDLTAIKPAVVKTTVTRPATKPVVSQTLNQSNHYFVNNQNGYYYDTAGAQTAAGKLSNYYEALFKVNQSTIVNGVTWYYGSFQDGKKAWVKAADLRSQLVKYYRSSYTLDQAVNKQQALTYKPQVQRVAGRWQDATREETRRAMDTQRIAQDPAGMYQFLKLDQYQGLEASDLDKLLKGKGILNGQGQAFKEAAITHNINENYLISHALLETGNGTSTLSNGGYVDSKNQVITNQDKKYYNMFGVGAFDHDAVRNGFKTAENNGWDTVRKSIVGGAKFIKDKYIGTGQNTLYRMRWNPHNPAVHQYATDITWADHNAKRMKNFYDQIGEVGKYFDIDTYKTK